MCPRRLLDEPDCDALEVVDLWLATTPFSMGSPAGPPEWPAPGGYLDQDARVADAMTLIRNHWPHVTAQPKKTKEPMVRRK